MRQHSSALRRVSALLRQPPFRRQPLPLINPPLIRSLFCSDLAGVALHLPTSGHGKSVIVYKSFRRSYVLEPDAPQLYAPLSIDGGIKLIRYGHERNSHVRARPVIHRICCGSSIRTGFYTYTTQSDTLTKMASSGYVWSLSSRRYLSHQDSASGSPPSTSGLPEFLRPFRTCSHWNSALRRFL